MRWVLLVLLSVSSAWLAAEPTDDAKRLYQGFKDTIYQIRIIEKASGNKAAIGSGFQISADGVLVSNYHVISDALRKPNNYLIQYQATDGSSGNLQVIAVDVIHDLALLKHSTENRSWLELFQGAIEKGTRIFSVGNPHDLGMTVVEGTYNGLVDRSLYERVLVSGSLNPGMSGGPTINRQGQVVGVNVSTAGNQISFLVPVDYVQALLAKRQESASAALDWNAWLQQQLVENQNQLMQKMLALEWRSEPLGDASVPSEIAPFVKCWGDTDDQETNLYVLTHRTCHIEESLYLGNYFSTGVFRFQYQWFESDQLNPLRFYSQMEMGFFRDEVNLAQKDDVTAYECTEGFVQSNGQNWKIHWCVRQYKRFPLLFDVSLSMASLSESTRGLIATMAVSGIDQDNTKQFTQRFIESVQWNFL